MGSKALCETDWEVSTVLHILLHFGYFYYLPVVLTFIISSVFKGKPTILSGAPTLIWIWFVSSSCTRNKSSKKLVRNWFSLKQYGNWLWRIEPTGDNTSCPSVPWETDSEMKLCEQGVYWECKGVREAGLGGRRGWMHCGWAGAGMAFQNCLGLKPQGQVSASPHQIVIGWDLCLGQSFHPG